MKTILVPTDFSEAAINASEYAAELAKEMKEYEVLLYHAYNIPIIVSAEMSGTMMVNIGELEESINLQLAEAADNLIKKTGVSVRYKTTAGPVVEGITDIEGKIHPCIIVMGLSTSGAVIEFVFGSTATDVLRKINAPLIIVPEKAKFKKIEKMIFTNDYKLEEKIVMDKPIQRIIKQFSPQVSVLNVYNKVTDLNIDNKHVENLIDNYFNEIPHHFVRIEHEDVIEGINDFIKEKQIDLVTMIPHKHNMFEKLFNEGFTKKLAFHTEIPLLSIPAHSETKYLDQC